MTTSLFDLVALAMQGSVLLHPVPPDVLPRNDVEQLVLAREDEASRLLEARLAAKPNVAYRLLGQAGFRRIRPESDCANYVYTRQIGPDLDRGASVIICPGKRPFVLRTDEGRGPFIAPVPGAPGTMTVPVQPRP